MLENDNSERKVSSAAVYAAVIASLLILTIRIKFGAIGTTVIVVSATIAAIYGLYEIKKSQGTLKGIGMCIYALILCSFAYMIMAWVLGDKLIVTQQEIIYEELQNIGKELAEYKRKNGCWPTFSIGLSFMDIRPKDPWGYDYLYKYTGDCVNDDRSDYFVIYTLGKDAVAGGKGENADLAYKSNNYRLYVNDDPIVP